MMKKIILGIIMFILVLSIVNAQLIEPKEPKEPQEISYNLDTSVFGGVTVTRTETQAEFTPVSEEFIGSKFRVCFNELTIEDKVNLITAGHNLNDGIPVIDHRKPIFKVTEKEVIEKGKLVKQNVSEFTGYEKLKYLNHSAQDCVYIPLDSEGDIHIGFTSTIYTVDKFTYGSCINCNNSAGNVTLLWNGTAYDPTTGNYTSGLIDLNTTRKFKTVSWNWTGESGTNVTLRVQSASLAKPNISDEGLVGYWLDGTHGCDDVLGNNNGTAHGGVVCDGTDEGAFYGENATAFDGVNDYVVNADGLDNVSFQDSFTISFWVLRKTTANNDFIIAKSNNCASGTPANNNGWHFKTTAGGLVFQVCKGAQYSYTGISLGYPINEWIHVVGKYDNITSNTSVYKNGNLDGTLSYTYGKLNTNYSFQIGTRDTSYFNGSIAHVAIYNRSLSADEILNLSSWTSKLTDPSNSDISSLPDNRFYRFESILNTDNTTHTPVLQWVKTSYASNYSNPISDPSNVNISFPLSEDISTLNSDYYYLYFDIYTYGIDQPNNKSVFMFNEFPKLNYVSNLGATTITGDRAETQYQVANVWRR